MEYAKTRDILHVMQILGHRSIQNTLIYTHLVDFKEDEYVAKVAKSEEEVCKLVEAGFEYVCDYDGNKIFRKRNRHGKKARSECPGVQFHGLG